MKNTNKAQHASCSKLLYRCNVTMFISEGRFPESAVLVTREPLVTLYDPDTVHSLLLVPLKANSQSRYATHTHTHTPMISRFKLKNLLLNV